MECKKLLEKARDVLGDYCFSEDGEYNNNDVIKISREIDGYFERGEKSGKVSRVKG